MTNWERRIARAQALEQQYRAAAELLAFYRLIAGFQSRILPAPMDAEGPRFVKIPESLRYSIAPLLSLLEDSAPEPLAKTARILRYTQNWGGEIDPADPAARFIYRVLLQPYAESLAQRHQPIPSTQQDCPYCGEPPVVAVLRPEGEGGKRSLICSLCFTEWDYRRLLCPRCGEEDHHKLPIYTNETFAHVRIEACDTCHTYVKSIDLTRNGHAVPEVDELAALPLDVWAAEHQYTKLQTNLFGL